MIPVITFTTFQAADNVTKIGPSEQISLELME